MIIIIETKQDILINEEYENHVQIRYFAFP
jgi:hypothetical protein